MMKVKKKYKKNIIKHIIKCIKKIIKNIMKIKKITFVVKLKIIKMFNNKKVVPKEKKKIYNQSFYANHKDFYHTY
jgi:hypothetical protein